jgi:glutamine amidotransferase
MRGGGTVNADGFGVGWYGADGEPVRYRRAVPMWTDANFATLAPAVAAGAVLAAVRSATVGMPITETACAPFAGNGWLFSHNGRVTGWPDSLAGLAGRLPVTDLLTLDAPTDAAVLWAVLRHRIAAGAAPATALADLVTEVGAAAPGSRLNLLLTDGTTVLATAWHHSLSVLVGGDGVVVASEPWDDDPRWQPVPDRHLVVADRHGVELITIDQSDPAATSTDRTSP